MSQCQRNAHVLADNFTPFPKLQGGTAINSGNGMHLL